MKDIATNKNLKKKKTEKNGGNLAMTFKKQQMHLAGFEPHSFCSLCAQCNH